MTSGWLITVSLLGGPLDGCRAQMTLDGRLDSMPAVLSLDDDTGRYVRQVASDGGQMHTTDGAYGYEWQTLPKGPDSA